MGDCIGTDGEVLWLERIEGALYQALYDAICGDNTAEADKWLGMLERLSIV